jgi:K+ transporter
MQPNPLHMASRSRRIGGAIVAVVGTVWLIFWMLALVVTVLYWSIQWAIPG